RPAPRARERGALPRRPRRRRRLLPRPPRGPQPRSRARAGAPRRAHARARRRGRAAAAPRRRRSRVSSPGRVRGPLPRALASGPPLWVALALTAVTLRLLAIPLERDEGDFAYGAQRLLDGAAPWAEVYGMRPPGVYAAYALAIAAFGPSAEAIRLGLLCANASTAALLFGLGRRVADAPAGAAAAVAFAALSLGSAVLGPIAHTEHFALLPLVAALWLLLGPAGVRRAVAAGLLLGLALATKQNTAPLVAFGVAVA